MAISRAQIPEQIDIFNQGGAASTSTMNTLSQQLRDTPTYEESYQKYYDRLSQVTPPRKKMNIYEVASELGAIFNKQNEM